MVLTYVSGREQRQSRGVYADAEGADPVLSSRASRVLGGVGDVGIPDVFVLACAWSHRGRPHVGPILVRWEEAP